MYSNTPIYKEALLRFLKFKERIEFSKELNKHFEQKRIVQPQEKKTIQNLVNDFRNAFEDTDDSKTNVSTEDKSLATNDISITELAHFLNDDTSTADSPTQDLVEHGVGDSRNTTPKNQASSESSSYNQTTFGNAREIC